MQRIKCVKKVFGCFAFDKASLSIIKIDREKSKACLPFIGQPAASDDSLGSSLISEKIHDQQENVALPTIVCIQFY